MPQMVAVSLIGGALAMAFVVTVAYDGTIAAYNTGVDPDTYGIPRQLVGRLRGRLHPGVGDRPLGLVNLSGASPASLLHTPRTAHGRQTPEPERMLAEGKDLSELMVDLAYAALYFGDPDMAEEVDELEERMEALVHDARCASWPAIPARPTPWRPSSA